MAISRKASYRRFFAFEIAVNAIISAAFGGLFAWLLFGTHAIATPLDKYRFSLDFLPQTFMTALMSYAVPGISARIRLRKGHFERRPTRIGRVNDVPFVGQIVLAAMLTMLTAGACAAFLADLLVHVPVSHAEIMMVKIAYGAILSIGIAAFALVAALGSRSMSGVRPSYHDDCTPCDIAL